ncbi:MAG: DUF1874 domain-containing protein [Microcystis sp. M20BS1]|uniref:STIV orfB116 family protein n=1 Tax=unclassified Microcystis TaxID=2643300 RepID=UPI00338DDCC4|nr:DUF1874 domain-containing protein [Microcystis sp. M19BS1]MCA2633360.1 DUF1874 domain-containing protein [Microcystis sp. M20BS1]
MLYVLNSFPNSLYPTTPGEAITNTCLSEKEARILLSAVEWTSALGHLSTAELLSARLGVNVPVNRIQVPPGAEYIVCLFVSPRRLAEGERWTEEDILQFDINYILVK